MTFCKYGDPYCPCQDGAACHYEDCGSTKAMKQRYPLINKTKTLANALMTAPNDQCKTVDQWMQASRKAGEIIKVLVEALEFYQGIGKNYEQWLEGIQRKGNMVAADAIEKAENIAEDNAKNTTQNPDNDKEPKK